MSQYESYPAGGNSGYGGQPARMARPKSTDLAVKLIWASIVLGIIGAIISFTTIDSQLEAAGIDPDTASGATTAGVVVGVVFALVFSVAIPVLLAVFIGKGANWARIVYTVLGVLGILLGVFGLIGVPALQVVIQLVSLILTIVIIVLLFRPDSNAYFTS